VRAFPIPYMHSAHLLHPVCQLTLYQAVLEGSRKRQKSAVYGILVEEGVNVPQSAIFESFESL